MARDEKFSFRPDFSDAGQKSGDGEGASYLWFSPVGEPESRLRYAVIDDELDGMLQIEPGEGRFKKGLKAWCYRSEEGDEHTEWVVLKTRPNRIDLKQV